jgi:hypothetical protein
MEPMIVSYCLTSPTRIQNQKTPIYWDGPYDKVFEKIPDS